MRFCHGGNVAEEVCNVNERVKRVMSSSLCKKAEGAIFPLLVEAMEDGVDDALDAEFVDEADHWPRSAAHFHEAAFDDIGGA